MDHNSSKTVVVAALIANFLIACAKFLAAAMTRSSAMLAEAFHSLADTANQGFLLLGVKLSSKPADGKHPFGYAKERYFWAFIVAICIFTVGATFSCYEGIHKILHAEDPQQALKHPWWGIGVLAISILLEGFSWVIAYREFRQIQGPRSLMQTIRDARDPIVITVLFEDSAALFGLLTALAGLSAAWVTGNMIYDGLASMVVGVVLALVAFFLAKETKEMLIGEGVPSVVEHQIRQIVQEVGAVNQLLDVRTLHFGPEDVLAALKIAFNEQLVTAEVEQAINEVEARLRGALPQLKRIWIEPGCRPGKPS